MNMRKGGLVLTFAVALINRPTQSQTADNKDVKSAAATATTSATPPPEAPKKLKLKGGFRGHAIESPEGQTLADVVKAAHADRAVQAEDKTQKQPIVLSNESVKPGVSKPASSSTKTAATASTPAVKAAPVIQTAAPVFMAPPVVDTQGRNETFWRKEAQTRRENVAQAQARLEHAEEDTKKQENDFYAWDDGQYRDRVIKPAWDRAKAEEAAARESLDAAKKALADLDDDARKAGAMPGWIRE